jgi:rhodanese-related sulfurtransferase
MASPTEITPAQLARLVGTPQAPVLIDVRIDEDFAEDPHLIPGARRHGFLQVESLVPELEGRSVVIYCQKGLKISQGAAALLRANGIRAETLKGGQVAWCNAGLPTVDMARIPKRNAKGQTVWVTRHRTLIDSIACPWLIRRFVDPAAQFLYVEPSQVLNVVDRFKATPFDVQGVFWSHRGDTCTFDTMINEFGIRTEALDMLASIVRGAESNRHDLAPEAAGLLALSQGLSRIYRDDLEQLDAGMPIYDALYRWARDAQTEGHDWTASSDGK